MFKVAVIVGSLRRESINRRFAQALAKLAEGTLEFEFIDLAELPIYNEDLWPNPPGAVLQLKQAIEAADAVLFVTPEYNRSIPALVKNVIDWGSRPHGKSSWPGKPAGIVGTSNGALGTAVAQAHLRHVVTACGMLLLPLPEVYFVNKPGLVTDDFQISDDKSRAFVGGYIAKFAAWIGLHATQR